MLIVVKEKKLTSKKRKIMTNLKFKLLRKNANTHLK